MNMMIKRNYLWVIAFLFWMLQIVAITTSYAQSLVDLNTATLQELTAVPGITEDIALEIINFRRKTPFKISDELKNVPGVTEDLYLKVKDRFFVSAIGAEDMEDEGYDESSAAEDEGASSLVDSVGGQDSVLDDLRRSPLDLNTTQKSDLLDLPGVTSELADAIIARRRQSPFKSVDELNTIKGMTSEVYKNIRPYVRVIRPEEREIFAGDIRFRIGPSISPSKPDTNPTKTYPYDNPFQIYNRTRLRFGSKYEAGFIIDAARWEPALSYQTMRELHLKKFYLRANDVWGFDKIMAGNYQLQYAQGLVFYYPYGELVRPIKVKARGIKADTGTNPNTYLRGFAFEKRWRMFDLAGFYSYKGLYSSLNADGTADFDLENDAKNDLGANTSDKDIARKDNLFEELVGGRVQWNFAKGTHISFIGYDANYSPTINPEDRYGNPDGLTKFRGDGNTVVGADFETWIRGINFFGEYAKSNERGRDKLTLSYPYDKKTEGDAWILQAMYNVSKFNFYVAHWDYDPDYVNPHSSALGGRSMRDKDYNQIGYLVGCVYKDRKLESSVSYKPVKYKIPQFTTNIPGESNDFWFDIKYKPERDYELYYRAWYHYYDDNDKVSSIDVPSSSEYTDLWRGYLRNRYQITYKPTKSLSLKARFDDSRQIYPDYNYEKNGWLSYFDIGYKLTNDLKLSLRYMMFDSDINMSSIDDMWPRVLVPMFWTQGVGKGRRWYLAFSQKLDRNTEIWMRYENLYYVNDGYDNHTFKVQFDHKWGTAPKKSTRQRRIEKEASVDSDSEFQTPGTSGAEGE